MKKTVYKSEKFKKRAQRKKNPFYNSFLNYNRSQRNSRRPQIAELETVILTAPKIFSIIKNHNEILAFFTSLNKTLASHKNAHLNMEGIELITEDAVLYLISRLEDKKIRFPKCKISGNFPSNHDCKQILFDCKFDKYVQTFIKPDTNTEETLHLAKGFDSDGTYVDKVLEFVESKINLDKENSGLAYGVITEVLVNSKNHAYKKPSQFSKWWMIAMKDKNQNIVHITLLDNGQGIPKTIRKNFSEKFSSFLLNFERVNKQKSPKMDADLIEAALKGEFKTRTGLKHRGTGMPTIFEATTNPQIENLVIISNFAYIKLGYLKEIKEKIILDKMFNGTLISWDFIGDPLIGANN